MVDNFSVDVNLVRKELSAARTGVGAIAGGVALGQNLADIIKPFFDGLMSVLRPVQGLLKAIGTVVGQLLRPLIDALMVLLIPILGILRPIVQFVNQMMAPFRAVALKFSAMASQAFAAGNTKEGMQYMMSAVTTIAQPIFVLISYFTLEIVQQMTNVLLKIMEFVAKGFDKLVDVFTWGSGSTFMQDMVSTLGSNIGSGFDDLQSSLLERAQQNLREVAAAAGMSVNSQFGQMSVQHVQAINNWSEPVSNAMVQSINRIFKTAQSAARRENVNTADNSLTSSQNMSGWSAGTRYVYSNAQTLQRMNDLFGGTYTASDIFADPRAWGM